MKQMKKYVAVWLVISFVLGLAPVLWAEEGQKININQASVGELTQLHRVGTKYAQRIVAYREEHGPFSKPEDIMKVPGVSVGTFEANKERICVE